MTDSLLPLTCAWTCRGRLFCWTPSWAFGCAACRVQEQLHGTAQTLAAVYRGRGLPLDAPVSLVHPSRVMQHVGVGQRRCPARLQAERSRASCACALGGGARTAPRVCRLWLNRHRECLSEQPRPIEPGATFART